MRTCFIILIIFLALAVISSIILYNYRTELFPNYYRSVTPTTSTPSPEAIGSGQYSLPINDFANRITKKPFGIYVSPQNSPVSPERFTGYHTGADSEYSDTTSDVPVYAIADGNVVLSQTASGYGGVFMISFDYNGAKHTALYGHVRPLSMRPVGTKVTKGEAIGLLGTGCSSETDGERRHLHFSIRVDNSPNILGYVQTESELAGWIDPQTVF